MDERIIRAKLSQLRQKAVTHLWPIDGWQARSADFTGVGEYRYDGDWSAVHGETAWPAGKTLFIRANATTPQDAPLSELHLQFDLSGLEGLLSINGAPYAGIDANHLRVPLTTSGPLLLEAEFVCLLSALSDRELMRESARLRRTAFVQVDPEIDGAYFDLWFAWEASQTAKDTRRQQRLHAALEAALLSIDLTAPADQLKRDVAAARAQLRDQIAHIAPDPEAGRIFLTGHSHIDTAWLWPLRETVRKCGRTFATACRLLERYPQYHFSCSQPQLYAYAKEHFPAVYEEIKRWVKAGRWECTGGMWVEADCNVPSGEALIRQILFGLRFFRQEFGVRPRTCWLPDVFGYPGSMPQILKGCGLDNFYTNKLHWQARNPFPHHLFWWQGIDGTRVLAHIPRLKSYYNGWPNPQELNIAWDTFAEKAIYPEVMLPFGFGDGGGGPTAEMLEFAARAEHFPGVPAARQGLEETYFDDARATPDLPVWSGELYLETHRGTYTTQSAIKRANRKNELLLREAEIWSTLAQAQGATVDSRSLQAAWETLLLLQFHDILPGSSIGEVYTEAAVSHAHIERDSRQVRDQAIAALTSPSNEEIRLAVFNSLSWPRSDVVTATVRNLTAEHAGIVQPDGQTVPAQIVARRGDEADVVFVPREVPPVGYAAFEVRAATGPAQHSLRAQSSQIESPFYGIELDAGGCLTRLFDKRHQREVIPPGARANQLQLFQDGPEREAAWNVHDTFERREYDWDGPADIRVVEQGPVRSLLRVTRRYRDSAIEQDLIVYDQLPRIDFVTRADWQERQVMLKAAFPVDVMSPRAAFEVQFGAVERPTHRNTSWDEAKFEVCAHRWADLSEPGYGVSLLNDCRYGYDVKGNVLRLTLLRGAEWPDPDADRGRHEFTYSLLPHSGDWCEGETVCRAWELNAPMLCVNSTADGARSFVQVDGPAILEALKPADDGNGWIVRVYEPHGGRGNVRVHLTLPIRQVVETNMVEEGLRDVPFAAGGFEFAIKPFEVKTFRIVA